MRFFDRTLFRRVFEVLVVAGMLVCGARCFASAALLMEEPYDVLGAFNPTGHSAVYLNHVCADSPTQLRMCHDGEYGVVISRYHRVGGYDWVAIPLIPYLYAVTTPDAIPAMVTKEEMVELRDTYRRMYLENIAPDDLDGEAPGGDWVELVGEAYLRKIYGFEIETSPKDDERFVAEMNDKKNVADYNIFFRNCADFSRAVLNSYYPHAVHRNIIADFGLTTPKQVARSVVKYGKKHPELQMSVFVIPQVPGEHIKRSHPVDGVAESLVKSKKYMLPLVALNPEVAGGVVVAYLLDGRMKLPKNATIFNVEDAEVTGRPALPVDNSPRWVITADTGWSPPARAASSGSMRAFVPIVLRP